jgi:hypothetical protein
MRTNLVLLLALVALGGALWAWHDARLRAQLTAAGAENQRLTAQIESANQRLAALEASRSSLSPDAVGSADRAAPAKNPAPGSAARMAALETQVRELRAALAHASRGPAVPEYDPTQPPPPPAEVEAAPATPTNSIAKRSWGSEQALGPPDTERAGDVPTAWASREPDAGLEWLSASFDQAVDIAEVRIRESYNPGAISKVATVVNGQELVLWEGTAQGGAPLRDFVVRPAFPVRANAVIVYLDTARVPGWNEIDAVELVGRDGSRQWATAASASSTYAERNGSGNSDWLLSR